MALASLRQIDSPKPFTASHLHILMGRACHTVLIAREGLEADLEREEQCLIRQSPASAKQRFVPLRLGSGEATFGSCKT